MMNNLFNTLFDLDKGYITNNIISLNNNKFIENFDKNKLGYILNNINDISELYREDARNEVPLDKYYKKSKNNFIEVEYKQANNGLYGRYQAINSLSGQGMIREARHTIFKDFYIDLDIDNCHPVITKWLCENLNISCKYLNEYVYNREKYIKQLIKLNPKCDREYFKKVFLKISYGCGDKSYNDMVENKTDFIEKFKNEIKTIQELISKKLYRFLELNTEQRNKRNKKYNYYGSTLSHICQFVENQLLMHIIKYLQEKRNLDIQDSILCFDGIMINKNKYDENIIPELEDLFNDMDINIKMSVKNMDLDKAILSKCDYNENKEYKYIFEIEKKYLNLKENYYYCDFINGLIENKKIWNWDDLEEYFISNVNRVMFLLLSQKNSFFGKYNSKEIQPIEPSQHIISYYEEDKIKKISFEKLLNKHFYNDVHMYNDLEFIPYTKDDKPKNIDNRNFNLYQGFQAELLEKENVNMEIIEPILNHWRIVLAGDNDENYKYQLSYFHRIFKYPSRRTKTMMLFKSDNQQIGKGILLNKLIGELIFGNMIYKVNNGLSFINDRFNTDQAGALLNITEELSSIDDSYNATFDKLKSLCCDDKINIEPKFGKKYSINNYTNYIFNTNNKFPVKIESGDARFAVFECDERYHKNFNYFNELLKHINQETANHLYSYIYYLDDPVDPREIPTNKFYKNIKYNCLHSSVRFLYDIKDFNYDCDYDYGSWESFYIDKYNKEEKIIKSSDLNETYKLWCKFNMEKNTSMARFKTYTSNYILSFRNNKGIYYNINSLNCPDLEN